MRKVLFTIVSLLGCTNGPSNLLPVSPLRDPPELRVVARLLDEQLDTGPQLTEGAQVLLALVGPDADGAELHPSHHRPNDLKVLQILLGYQGVCPPPEASCFRGGAGVLLRMSLPRRLRPDSAVVWAELAQYRPDPRWTWPPNIGVRPQPPGEVKGPCPWSFTGGWVIFTGDGPPRWYGGPELQAPRTRRLCIDAG